MSAKNMMITPTATQMSCFVKSDERPLAVYVALYTAARPTSAMAAMMPTMAQGRLSNRLWVSIFHKLLDDFSRNGSGSRAAMSPMLHQHGHGDLRVVDRGIGNEPGMVLLFPRQFSAGDFLRDDLGDRKSV